MHRNGPTLSTLLAQNRNTIYSRFNLPLLYFFTPIVLLLTIWPILTDPSRPYLILLPLLALPVPHCLPHPRSPSLSLIRATCDRSTPRPSRVIMVNIVGHWVGEWVREWIVCSISCRRFLGRRISGSFYASPFSFTSSFSFPSSSCFVVFKEILQLIPQLF